MHFTQWQAPTQTLSKALPGMCMAVGTIQQSQTGQSGKAGAGASDLQCSNSHTWRPAETQRSALGCAVPPRSSECLVARTLAPHLFHRPHHRLASASGGMCLPYLGCWEGGAVRTAAVEVTPAVRLRGLESG